MKTEKEPITSTTVAAAISIAVMVGHHSTAKIRSVVAEVYPELSESTIETLIRLAVAARLKLVGL